MVVSILGALLTLPFLGLALSQASHTRGVRCLLDWVAALNLIVAALLFLRGVGQIGHGTQLLVGGVACLAIEFLLQRRMAHLARQGYPAAHHAAIRQALADRRRGG